MNHQKKKIGRRDKIVETRLYNAREEDGQEKEN